MKLLKLGKRLRGIQLKNLREWLLEDPNRTKGEMVLMWKANQSLTYDEISPQAVKALELIAEELPLKKAAAIVAELYGYKKNALYQFGLAHLEK